MTDAYLQPYRDAQAAHGVGFDVTLWARPATQRRRCEVFTQMLELRGKRLLDAGCSRGDLAAYLLEHGVEYGQYLGVDGLASVVEHARQRGLPRSRFEVGDLVRQPELLALDAPDVVAVSGTLNTMDLDTALTLLENAWLGCRQALIFNFLSDREGPQAPPQEYPARRLPTMKLLDWALDQTPSVQLRQDYLPHGHDATILLQRA